MHDFFLANSAGKSKGVLFLLEARDVSAALEACASNILQKVGDVAFGMSTDALLAKLQANQAENPVRNRCRILSHHKGASCQVVSV